MTIKELKIELNKFDENEEIYIQYECGNGHIYSKIQSVHWIPDIDSDYSGIISINGV